MAEQPWATVQAEVPDATPVPTATIPDTRTPVVADGADRAAGSDQTAAAIAEPAATTEPTPPPPTPEPTVEPTPAPRTYTVKAGDTLSRIALQQGVTTASIVAANQLPSADSLKVGQVLIIPDTAG
jgi:LysM repeat protein